MRKRNGISENSTKNLLQQGSILMIASILVRVMGLIYRIPLTNLWGDQGLGTYGDAYQVYTLFLIISSVSVPTMMSKMMGERLAKQEYADAKKVFRCALYLVGGMGFVCTLVMWFANSWIAETFFHNADAALVIRVLSPTVLIVSVMSVFRGYFNGTINMRPTALSQLIEGFFNAVVSVVMALLLYQISLSWSVAGGILGTSIGALMGLFFLVFCYTAFRKRNPIGTVRIRQAQEETAQIYCQMGKLMIPIILASTMFNLKSLVDASLFTKLMLDEGEAKDVIQGIRGIYTGKFTMFLNVPIAFGDSLATALVPSVSSCVALGQNRELKKRIHSVTKTVLLITVPAAMGLGILGKPILRMFFPASPLGGEMFWIGSLSVINYAINYVATGILQGMNKPHIPTRNGLFWVVTTCLLNILLIKSLHLGAFALPINSVVFSFGMMVSNLFYAQKYCRMKIQMGRLLRKPVICSSVMAFACFIFYVLLFAITGSNSIATLGAIVIAVIVYFFSMVNCKGITEKDMNELPFGRVLRYFRI